MATRTEEATAESLYKEQEPIRLTRFEKEMDRREVAPEIKAEAKKNFRKTMHLLRMNL